MSVERYDETIIWQSGEVARKRAGFARFSPLRSLPPIIHPSETAEPIPPPEPPKNKPEEFIDLAAFQ